MQFPLALLLVATIQVAFGFDLAAYKDQYQTQVGVPYKIAVTVVTTNIVEYLARSPVPTTAAGGQQVVANLRIQARSFSVDLGTASNSSDTLRQQLDHELENVVAQASAVEKQITDNEQQLQQTNGLIQKSTDQVNEAQNQLNVAQKSVQDAENTLRREEDRVKDAEDCIGLGWLGKQICKVVNHDGIRNAEHARDQARGDLSGQQQRLAQYQTQLAQQHQQLANLQQTRAGFEATKVQLNGHLSQLKLTRDNVNNVDTQIKAVVTHVVTLLGKSQVLVDVVKSLIDMETVIKPLTAIADQIIGYTSNPTDIAYLNAMKQKLTANLPLVQLKLAQYALIPPAA